VKRAQELVCLCYAGLWFGLWGLTLMPVSVLVGVLFHVKVTVRGFIAGTLVKTGSILKCGTIPIPVACAGACAVSCLQLLLITGL
jgi:hypothetical protein